MSCLLNKIQQYAWFFAQCVKLTIVCAFLALHLKFIWKYSEFNVFVWKFVCVCVTFTHKWWTGLQWDSRCNVLFATFQLILLTILYLVWKHISLYNIKITLIKAITKNNIIRRTLATDFRCFIIIGLFFRTLCWIMFYMVFRMFSNTFKQLN